MGTSHIIGDERVDAAPTWEYALIHRQDDHIAEIQVARLEQTHHLQSLQGLSRERDDSRRRQTINQVEDRAALQRLAALGKGSLELVEHVEIHVQERLLQGHLHTIGNLLFIVIVGHGISPLHLVEQQAAKRHQVIQIIGLAPVSVAIHRWLEQVAEGKRLELHSGNAETVGAGQFGRECQHLGGKIGLHQRVGKDIVDILAVVSIACLLLAGLVMQARDNAHERDDARSAQGVTQRDIQQRHTVHRVQQRHQQSLVGEHNRRLDAWRLTPVPHELHLVKGDLGLPHG